MRRVVVVVVCITGLVAAATAFSVWTFGGKASSGDSGEDKAAIMAECLADARELWNMEMGRVVVGGDTTPVELSCIAMIACRLFDARVGR